MQDQPAEQVLPYLLESEALYSRLLSVPCFSHLHNCGNTEIMKNFYLSHFKQLHSFFILIIKPSDLIKSQSSLSVTTEH